MSKVDLEIFEDEARDAEIDHERRVASFVEFMSFDDFSQVIEDCKAYADWTDINDPYLRAKGKLNANLSASINSHGGESKEDRARRAEACLAALTQLVQHTGEE